MSTSHHVRELRLPLGAALAALVIAGCVPRKAGQRGPADEQGARAVCARTQELEAERVELERELARVGAELAREPISASALTERRLALYAALVALDRELARGCEPGLASAAPAAGEARESPEKGKEKNRSPAEERAFRAARALAALRAGLGPNGKLAALRTRVAGALADARQARDVAQSLCLNQKLVTLDGMLSLANERVTALEAAEQSGDEDRTKTETGVLRALASRADELAREANNCIGQEFFKDGFEIPAPTPKTPNIPEPPPVMASASPSTEPNEPEPPPPPGQAGVVNNEGPPPDLAPALERVLGALGDCLPGAPPRARFRVAARVDRGGALREIGVRPDDDNEVGPVVLACLESVLARVRVERYDGEARTVSFPLWLQAP